MHFEHEHEENAEVCNLLNNAADRKTALEQHRSGASNITKTKNIIKNMIKDKTLYDLMLLERLLRTFNVNIMCAYMR